jgi:hypothetical protein
MKVTMPIVLGLAVVSAIEAASPVPAHTAAPSPTPACIAAEFRQFDFWLGHWKVTNPKGKQVGTSEISRVSEGCAIREQWKSASGSNGMSVNYYDPADRKWHQDWIGGDGLILHLQGELVGGAMVLSGQSKSPRGIVLNRITWTPLPDGKVKQEWTSSPDNGKTWETSFVGIYGKQP